MTSRVMKFWLPLVVLVSFPTVAFADVGTPLMWAGAFHLFIGNTIIGIAEGLILAILFRQKKGRCVLIMIAANYFSAWAGTFLLAWIANSRELDLYNAWQWFWIMVVITYFLTLLLEWPFVVWCLRKCDRWFIKSIWGSLAVQSASYLVLFGWYWMASATSLYTDVAIVQSSEISMPESVVVYYIAENDHDVYALDLRRGATKKVGELKAAGHFNWLSLQESRADVGRWDIVAELVTYHGDDLRETVVAAAANRAAELSKDMHGSRHGGDVPRFLVEDKSGWQFRFGWMMGRLNGNNTNDGRTVEVGLETPYFKWPVHNPTQLPNGQVIFQLGSDQICILDPDEKKVALIAKGRGPAVVLDVDMDQRPPPSP
jgi:hypothetical protein